VTLHEAVRQLRAAETRQSFATRLGFSITAIQNYESDRAPDVRALLVFLKEALARQEQALAEVFAGEINARVGVDINLWRSKDIRISVQKVLDELAKVQYLDVNNASGIQAVLPKNSVDRIKKELSRIAERVGEMG
jgi:hypothetical protein